MSRLRRSLALATVAAAVAGIASAASAAPSSDGARTEPTAAAARAERAGTAARAPRVTVRILGSRGTIMRGRKVVAKATTVRVDGRRCAVAAGTPLAALLAARRGGRPVVRVSDYGACSRRAADGGGLFVRQIGRDRARGQSGWVYGVGRRVGTAGAADPYGPFGRGRLRTGQRVTWFWCKRAATCERRVP